jgi:enoyl-CoA hydratase
MIDPDRAGDNCVTVKLDGAVAVVSLNAPPLNLLTQPLRAALRETVERLDAEGGVRAIVLTGGQHFCAGADLNEFPLRKDPAVARAHCLNGHAMMRSLVLSDTPIIAAIEGACLGGGFEIALCCDLRIASSAARLGLPEIGRGNFPGTGGLPLLERLVGPSRAKRFAYSGAIFDVSSRDAADIVDETVEPGTALSSALAIAHRWAGVSAPSLQTIKHLIDLDFRKGIDAHLNEECSHYVDCYLRADPHEGSRAFIEKRAPVWSHR